MQKWKDHLLPICALSIALTVATTQIATAHIIQAGASGFQGGFEHPLTGFDHLLAMFADRARNPANPT